MKHVTAVLFLLVFTINLFSQTNYNDKYLIVLDIQNNFTKEKMNEKQSTKFLSKINSVIEKTNPKKVIYVETLTAALEIGLKGISVGFPDGLERDERLMLVNKNIFIKTRPNAFTSEKLMSFIKSENAEEFIVIGLAAEHCAMSTVLGGKELGYKMSVIPEAIVGTTPEDKQDALVRMKEEGIEMIFLN